MDLRRFRASGPNQPSPRRRQSIDGFVAPSRSLPRTPLAVPKVQSLQPKPNHPAPALRRRPDFNTKPVSNPAFNKVQPLDSITQPQPLLSELRARPVSKPVSHQVQPRYQAPVTQPLGMRRPVQQSSRAATTTPTKKPWQKRYVVVPAVIVAACFMVSVFNQDSPASPVASQTNNQTNQADEATAPEVIEPTYPTTEQAAAFETTVKELMADNPAMRSTVIATNLKTGKAITLGSNQPYIAASTGKLLTAATVYQQIEQGRMTLGTKLSNGQTVKYNLQTMIVDSNNASWDVLNSYVTRAKLTARAKEIGMTNYVNKTNSLSAADTNLLVRKLYDGELINSDHRTQLLGWMEEANYRGYMVAAIPSDYTIYHKVGIYEDVLHDVGIITKGDEAIELTVYTDGNGSAPDAARTAYIKAVTTAALKAFFAPSETGTTSSQPAI